MRVLSLRTIVIVAALAVIVLVLALGAWVWIGVTNDQYSQLDRRLDSVTSLGDINSLINTPGFPNADLPMPDGSVHDGFWYASDIGGAIHAGRIDLFTGQGAGSMRPLMPLNLATLKVIRTGVFNGCPPN